MVDKCILVFATLWKIKHLLFLVAPYIVGICLLWKHILKMPPLDH
jgi:hypothetical protein